MKKSGRSLDSSLKELRIKLAHSLSSEEKWAVVTECKTRIQHLEETVKELKQELKTHIKEGFETQRYMNNRRLLIYLAIASILGGFLSKLLELLITRLI
jgi:hypothetical protein